MDKEFNNSLRLQIPKELTKNRYVKPSGLSKEDAKKIALANGIIWED